MVQHKVKYLGAHGVWLEDGMVAGQFLTGLGATRLAGVVQQQVHHLFLQRQLQTLRRLTLII